MQMNETISCNFIDFGSVFINILSSWLFPVIMWCLTFSPGGPIAPWGPASPCGEETNMLRTFHLMDNREILCQTTCSSLTWAPGLPCCPGGPGSPWGPWRKRGVNFSNLVRNTKIDYFIYESKTSRVKKSVICCSICSIKSEMQLSTDINQKLSNSASLHYYLLIRKQANSTISCSGLKG